MQVLELLPGDYDDFCTTVPNGSVDVAFRKINKHSTSFLIWKVENLGLVAVPKDNYGTFVQTECYVIYSASIPGQVSGVDSVARDVKGTILEYHIHFWLGIESTREQSVIAANKTLELDAFLGLISTEHRESQENESARFRGYFKNGLRYSITGENGLGTVPKLYKIRSKSVPIIKQLKAVSWSEFNSSDVFLLSTKETLFLWIGRAADAATKLSATMVATKMKEEREIPIVFVDDGYEKTLQDNDKNQWNKYLPLDKRHVLPDHETNSSVHERTKQIRLYKCSEDNGKYRMVEVKYGQIVQDDLESGDVFILDQELNGVWIWVSRRASEKERNDALRKVRGFVKKKQYANNTKVVRVVEGHEPNEFKHLFDEWQDKMKQTKKEIRGKVLVSKYDAISMEERCSLAAETQLIDDGSGSLTVWRIQNASTIIKVPKERHGYFFTGDCYIVLYTYQTTQYKHLLYYWIGDHASKEEILCAQAKVAEIDANIECGFKARVFQGFETPHFLQIFKGKLTIFTGLGSDFDETGLNMKSPTQYFLKVFGSNFASSKAIQIPAKASHLNSNFCYVLKRGKHSYIWCGNYSTGDQKEMAKLFAGKDFELILEGKEKQEFFQLLGGQTPYFQQLTQHLSDVKSPRLFLCYKIKDIFQAEVIFFYAQSDLLPENVMFVDFHNVIYVWIGKLSSREDQKRSLEMANEYLRTDPQGRNLYITIILINQGYEPPTFKGFFPSWDDLFWKEYKTFGKLRQHMESNSTTSNGTDIISNGDKSGNSNFDNYDKYPIDILKEPNEKLPSRVDPLNKELHLTHDDFVTLLKMSYSDFEKLPKWKQQELKKQAGLF